MSNIDLIESIVSLEKDVKINWERLLLKYKNHELNKENIREFKSEILIPNLDKVTDLAIVIVERKRADLYPTLINFLKNLVFYSSYYQRNKLGIRFNFSSETEHLSVLLPAYEATVRMYMIGAVAIAQENYFFISELARTNIQWMDDENGKKLYRSILFHPWFDSDFGAGNLTTYFEDAKKRLSEDNILLERYFSLITDNYVDCLCQFDFLVGLKIQLLGQDKLTYFPYYPNYARYYFNRTQEIIQKLISREENITKYFQISEKDFKFYLKDLIDYCQKHNSGWQYSWLDTLPNWLGNYVK